MSHMTTDKKYDFWCDNTYFDKDTREELLSLTDQKEIEDRFYTDLVFGTGGMRGVLGAGTNRMNKYVLRKVTQGLAETIKDQGETARKRGVVIAFDSRKYSDEFALETALVLAANGIKAYLFDDLRPTPELSFAVRFLKAQAGVNITASHNPKEYNGYKVYWEDGGQIPPNKAKKIITNISRLESWEITSMPESEAIEAGLLIHIGQEIDKAYTEAMKETLLFPELAKKQGEKLKIVFTPLHGTGGKPVENMLRGIGFSSLFVVPEQAKPDCDFPTVETPNPEDECAFQLGLEYAAQKQAHIVLATDPDADRLGLYAKDKKGEYRRFTGNEIGVLLEYYLLSQNKRLGKLKKDAVVIKTVASTDLGEAIAEKFGVKLINVLVGFKYIGEKIKEMEEEGWGSFLFGFEESFGYLAGTYARDKDAVQAAALLSEAALYYQVEEQKGLPEVLEEIYQLFGYYRDEQVAISLQGKEGKDKILRIMEFLRQEKPRKLGGQTVSSIEDFLVSQQEFLAGEPTQIAKIDLPQENVLKFSLAGGGYVMARPSGTEPKIRFYFCIKGERPEQLEQKLEAVKKDFLGMIQNIK